MTLVWFIILVGMLITVHELGHLVAARLFGIKVLKLSIGFGPRLASFKRGDTEYAIGVIPLGGYVRLLGEERGEEVSEAERPRAFHLRSPWQRLVVILAGPAANLVFPVIIFSHLYATRTSARAAVIGTVLDGQPAAGAGLKPGDKVVSIDGKQVSTWDDLNARVMKSPGRELRVTVERAGQDRPLTKVMTPRAHLRSDAFGVREKVGLLGVMPHFRLPVLGVESNDSPAYQAGLRTFDQIVSIRGLPVRTAADLEPLIKPRSGEMVVVTWLRPSGRPPGFAPIQTLQPFSGQVVPQCKGQPARCDAGLRPADLFIHDVEPGTPAARLGGVGLRSGDVLISLDGQPLTSWELLEQSLEERPEEEHTLKWRSGAAEHEARFKLEPRRAVDEYQGEATAWVFGAQSARARASVPEIELETHVVTAVWQAVSRALYVTATMVRVLGLTLVGELPASSIGGPLLIAQVAGVAAQHGAEQFLAMTALVSLNIGLLNLLPVPLLDGGQATLVLLEAARRRPVSRRWRSRAALLGALLMAALILLIIKNDVMRHLQ
jgi:regulator of sigma E protease